MTHDLALQLQVLAYGVQNGEAVIIPAETLLAAAAELERQAGVITRLTALNPTRLVGDSDG